MEQWEGCMHLETVAIQPVGTYFSIISISCDAFKYTLSSTKKMWNFLDKIIYLFIYLFIYLIYDVSRETASFRLLYSLFHVDTTHPRAHSF